MASIRKRPRAELVSKVREAIAAVGFDPADPDLYAMAEAAVDAVENYSVWMLTDGHAGKRT